MPQKISINLKFKFSGEAGEGIVSTGEVLMKVAAIMGYHSVAYKSFPPNIRGGYSQSLVTISENPIISALSDFDILFSLSDSSFKIDSKNIKNGNLVIIESNILKNIENKRKIDFLQKMGAIVYSAPVSKIGKEIASSTKIRSTITLGIISFLLDIPLTLMLDTILKRFGHKGSKIHDLNSTAVKKGFSWAKKNFNQISSYKILQKTTLNRNQVIFDGNQAISAGAIIAGCTFFSSYPITPATSIGECMAEHLPQVNGFSYQAEDEIAALGAVVGASFSGSKAMTATSGPGLSLMQEFIGYSSMIELPIVIVDVQRAGPSTGMPTKHGQDDLFAAIFGSHGESPRIVLSPTNLQDCFHTTVEAFNISEQYQCPVILLSDSSLAMISGTMEIPKITDDKITRRFILSEYSYKESFSRFECTENGLNPIPVPGFSPDTYRVSGVEHDKNGAPSVDCDNRIKQIKKRFGKIKSVENNNSSLIEWDLEKSQLYKADFSLIAWGLTASVAKQAVINLRKKGFHIAAIYPRLLYPVCKNAIETLLQFSSLVIIPESNFTGQYSKLIRMYTDANPVSFTLSRGEAFTPGEIQTFCDQIAGKNRCKKPETRQYV